MDLCPLLGRDKHSWRTIVFVSFDCLVNSGIVIGRVASKGCDGSIDLAEQRPYSRCISSVLAGEIAGNNLAGLSVDADMQLAPIPMLGWFAQIAELSVTTFWTFPRELSATNELDFELLG